MARNDRITLRSGREIELHELKQSRTYAGVLEGVPTKQFNKRLLNDLRKAYEKNARSTPVVLLTPRETQIDVGGPHPDGKPHKLPFVTCVARFRSEPFADLEPLGFSELIVIWLQNEFAMPIEPAALDQIVSIEWDKVARDFEV